MTRPKRGVRPGAASGMPRQAPRKAREAGSACQAVSGSPPDVKPASGAPMGTGRNTPNTLPDQSSIPMGPTGVIPNGIRRVAEAALLSFHDASQPPLSGAASPFVFGWKREALNFAC